MIKTDKVLVIGVCGRWCRWGLSDGFLVADVVILLMMMRMEGSEVAVCGGGVSGGD